MNNGQEQAQEEMTVRAASIFVLEKSPAEIDKIHSSIKEIGNFFDKADDAAALQKISDEIIPMLSSLYTFAASLLIEFQDVLTAESNELFIKIRDKADQLDILMEEIGKETEKANFTEVNDILRFDIYDLLTEIKELFPEIKKCFQESHRKDLDEL